MRCDYFHRQPRDALFVVRTFNGAIPPMRVCKAHVKWAVITLLNASGAEMVTVGWKEEMRNDKVRTKAGRGNEASTVRRVRGIRDLPEL